MQCNKCKAQIKDSAKFCDECGARVEAEQLKLEELYGNASRYDAKSEAKRQERQMLIIVIVVVLIVAAVAIAAIVGMSAKIKSDKKGGGSEAGRGIVLQKEEQSASPTPSPAEDAQPSDDYSYKNVLDYAPGYNAIRDDVYSFTCAYPAVFDVVKASSHYSLTNGSDDITIDIRAENNAYAFTGGELLGELKAEIGSGITYSDSGEKWYAISYKVGDLICYRKCLVNDLDCVYFEVVCSNETLDKASTYIDYMEKHFKFE